MMEAPSLERGAVLGAAAAGAFLTRPEGLLALALAVGWPVLEAIRRREPPARRLGGTDVTILTILLLLSPYLLWVKSVRGHWAMSVRPSAISAEKGVGIGSGPPDEDFGKAHLYGIFGLSLIRLSLHGVLVPFYVVGFASLKGVRPRDALFYLSVPVGQFAGILLTLRTHNFMSDRYIMAGMALLGAVAAQGMVAALRAAERRWPQARWRLALSGAAVFLIVVAPVAKAFKLRRAELAGYPAAARWILSQSARPPVVSGLEQVAYYCGSRSYYLPDTSKGLEEFLRQEPLDYIVYSQRDVEKRPRYVAMLRSHPRLEPPHEVAAPPGCWKVYVQRVR
jgi:hypothetical protein